MKNAQKNEVEGFDLGWKLNSSSSLVFTNFPSSESVWGAQMLWFLAWVHLYSVVQSCPTLCNPMDCSHPPRLLCPWDFPGKNTGVGWHFLLQGELPNPRIKPLSPEFSALAGGFLTIEPPGKPVVPGILHQPLCLASCSGLMDVCLLLVSSARLWVY